MEKIDLKKPEYHSFEDFQKRSEKLAEMREMGVDPYPHRYDVCESCRALVDEFGDAELGGSETGEKGEGPKVRVGGRLVLFRAMGQNAFGHIQDEMGRIQVMFNRDVTTVESVDEKPLKFIEKKPDLGDIIGVEGHLFRTNKGELTIYAKKVTLLCKTLLPLPDKHAGLQDKGVKYRKRWLDLITDNDVADTFRMRSEIFKLTREYFQDLNFTEVETPILQNIYGGAEAKPFVTHLNALSQQMFMRIALEIALKKLIVGGMGRVFEIGKVFRNEGIDKTHNPEFTMLEAYAAYMDYNDVMVVVENLFAAIAEALFGTTKIGLRTDKAGNQHEIDVKAPWIRMSMKDAIAKYGGIEVDKLSDSELLAVTEEHSEDELKGLPRGKLIANLFEEIAEPHLIQPHHIIDHPIETTPLCKLHRDPKLREEGIVERFESFILGYEFANCYSELNDPEKQRELLENQAEMLKDGDEEANPMDEEFLEAICQGMPPTGGLGIGMDRMTMLFTGATSIRDVLFFPLMRPES